MNKASKIAFLLVAMLMAIGAIVFYVKTIVSPPDELSFSNQYSKELKEDIGKVKGNITAQQLDSLYSTEAVECFHKAAERNLWCGKRGRSTAGVRPV